MKSKRGAARDFMEKLITGDICVLTDSFYNFPNPLCQGGGLPIIISVPI